MPISTETTRTLVRLGLETALYAALVVVYLFVVLSLFTDLLVGLFKQDRLLYAALALGLMVFQGFLLEAITSFLIDRLQL